MNEHHGTRPDVVLIHVHDLGRWLCVYGMPSVPSPRLQSFAESSVVFENAHSSAPLCSPARGSLFTGLSPHRHGVQGLAHHAWRYRLDVKTAPELLRPLGYRSTLIGLQHENTDPDVLGFDEVGGVGFLPRANQVVDAAEGWLQALPPRESRRPIFLTTGVWEVHRPWPEEDYEPADAAGVDVPAYLPDNEDTREDIAAFHGSIAQMDEAIGRLLDTIDRLLDPETTMIVFTTDHGAAFPRAKSTLYDAGTGVSLIVRAPTAWNVPAARLRDVVSHLDLVPTLLDVAGGEPQDFFEGESLLPLLDKATPGSRGSNGEPEEENGTVAGSADRVIVTSKSFHDAYDPMRAVRSQDFAYIRNFVAGPKLTLSLDLENSPTRRGMGDAHLAPRPAEELYDRRVDPDELNDVADDPAYEELRQNFAGILDSWMTDTADPLLEGRIALPPRRDRAVDALEPAPPIQPIHPLHARRATTIEPNPTDRI